MARHRHNAGTQVNARDCRLAWVTHDHVAVRVAGDASAHVAVAVAWRIRCGPALQLLDQLQS